MDKKSTITIITLILAGESIFFLPFVIARIFRPTLLEVFQITNTELGVYFSVYGLVAMISYFLGGPLADTFSSRNLMSIALWLTGVGGVIMATIPSSLIMVALYAFWGITTILLFWAALIKATRILGGEDFQGRAFGWLEGGRGLTAALLGLAVLSVYSWLIGEEGHVGMVPNPKEAFQIIIVFTSCITIAIGVLVWFFVPNFKQALNKTQGSIKAKSILEIVKNPSVYLLSAIVVCAYVGYKITDDFSLYAKDVLGFNDVKAAGVGTAALWARAFVAILAGYFGDKFKSITIILWCFIFTFLGSVVVAFGIFQQVIIIVILQLFIVMVGVYGVRGLYFALIKDTRISLKHTGTVIGLVSVVGFTPDVFMSPWMGYLLDNNPGAVGHQKVFLVLALFAALGLVASLVFKKFNGHTLG